MSQLKWYNAALRQYLQPEEIQIILRQSVWKSTWQLVNTWLWIALAFVLVAQWTNVLTVFVALFFLGGKQLACAIIMHDASHDSLFRGRKLNNFLGNWFGAFPIGLDVRKYRPYHHSHHRNTGLENDPDRGLTYGYPAGKASLARKFARDLAGITGLKALAGLLAMHFGLIEFELGGEIHWKNWREKGYFKMIKEGLISLSGPVTANAVLFAVFYMIGYPWLYGLWPLAYLTTYNFCLRVRSIAEHSMIKDRENPQMNSRTTYANWIERMLFAPLHVNYHAEHHLLMSAPSYNLPIMHHYLINRGYFEGGSLSNNYISILKKALNSK